MKWLSQSLSCYPRHHEQGGFDAGTQGLHARERVQAAAVATVVGGLEVTRVGLQDGGALAPLHVESFRRARWRRGE